MAEMRFCRIPGMLLLFCLLLTGLSACGSRPVPQPKVETAREEIICTAPEISGEEAQVSWESYLKEYGDDLVYVELNEPVTLTFEGEQPEELEIRDSIIDENGALRYQERGTELRAFSWDEEQQAYTIYIPGHFGSMLSSDSSDYEPGACLRGLEIQYRWKGESYISLLVLRTDAGLM